MKNDRQPIICGTDFSERAIRGALISILVLAIAASARAQAPAETPVEQLPPHVTRVEDVLVPVASEIFRTLDKFKDSNWRAVQRQEVASWRPRGDQASLALLLGVVIAEGFIAVEAEDAAEVKSLGRSLLTLARGLGVEQAALKRSRSIVDHAEGGDWAAVRKEWDHVLPDVQQGMHELKSHQLAHLVSLAGWARGTEALSALLSQRYSAGDAELLRQPTLLGHFEKHLGAVSGEKGEYPAVARATDGVQKFRRILDAAEPQIPPPTVKEIGTVAAELLKSIPAEGRKR